MGQPDTNARRGSSWLSIALWYLAAIALAQRAHAYTVTSVPYRWEGLTGHDVSLGDNEVSAPIPLPFSFKFLRSFPFLVPYTQVSIGSNGFITFLTGQQDGCTGEPNPCGGHLLPNANGPNAIVAGYWGDLDSSAGGTISYGTIGAAPVRVFIVQFESVPHAQSGSPVSFQIKLFESSNLIEIHCRSCQSNGTAHTQGIESESWQEGSTFKTNAVCYTTNPDLGLYVYGYKCSLLNAQGQLIKSERNAAAFSLTQDAVRFTPPNNRSGLGPVLAGGSAPIVKLRYDFRVDRNEAVDGAGPDFKLLFEYTSVYNPTNYQSGSNRDVYELDTAFYAQGMRYQDPLCYTGYGPPSQLVTFNKEATFRLSIPDYSGKGLTGQKTDFPSLFPRATSLGMIDGIASASGLVSQFDITGRNGTYLLSRAGVISEKAGWRYRAVNCNAQGVCSCQDAGLDSANPAHAFRQWDRTMTFDGSSYTTHEALPDDAATALVPWGPIGFATEYFFTKGRFRTYLWNLQVMREGSSTWESIDRWQVTDHDGSTRYFGYKLAQFNGHCVIEVSNDPDEHTDYLAGVGSGASTSVLSLSSCSVTPTVWTAPPSGTSASFATLSGVVNANGGAGTAWFEYGPTAILGSTTPGRQISGWADTPVSSPTAALTPGASYFYRLVASTGGGLVRGDTLQFSTSSTTVPCIASPNSLCLNRGRFEVTIEWTDYNTNTTSIANAVPFTSDTGYFWFFAASNVEIVVKVLDGTGVNGKYWVGWGALTDVGFAMTVRDSRTGTVKIYRNAPHNQAGGFDINAF